jgi:hypothetical protein
VADIGANKPENDDASIVKPIDWQQMRLDARRMKTSPSPDCGISIWPCRAD